MNVNIKRGIPVKNKVVEKNKVRAIIKTDEEKFLIVNYDGIYLFPGGKVEENENYISALSRELFEELGVKYEEDEFVPLINIHHEQSNYPERDGTITDRIINTAYFIAPYKGIDLNEIQLTEPEKNGNFKIEFLTEDEINLIIIGKNCKNPRNKFFMEELACAVKIYNSKCNKYNGPTKTLK